MLSTMREIRGAGQADYDADRSGAFFVVTHTAIQNRIAPAHFEIYVAIFPHTP